MSLSIGIVGLPNVGKSTTFNALTKNDILAANYPFATIEPNTGIVPIPDNRLDQLQELYPTAKKMPATVTFVDIAGLVAGASKGEGLGNQFLANIRECEAICHVVRAFENDDVVHVDNTISPERDIEVIETELMLADLETIGKRMPKLTKEARGNPKLKPDVAVLEAATEALEAGKPLFKTLTDKQKESETLKQLQLLSMKPVIYVFNIDEQDFANTEKLEKLRSIAAPAQSLFINAKLESDMRDLEGEELQEMLEMIGQDEPGLDKLVHAAYETLGLQSYLTAGEKEVRAWTIKQGSTAPQAAGVIHTDFERGFIAADIITFDDLIAAGSWASARSAGKVRTEGKTYVMQPDDVVEFKFNV